MRVLEREGEAEHTLRPRQSFQQLPLAPGRRRLALAKQEGFVHNLERKLGAVAAAHVQDASVRASAELGKNGKVRKRESHSTESQKDSGAEFPESNDPSVPSRTIENLQPRSIDLLEHFVSLPPCLQTLQRLARELKARGSILHPCVTSRRAPPGS